MTKEWKLVGERSLNAAQNSLQIAQDALQTAAELKGIIHKYESLVKEWENLHKENVAASAPKSEHADAGPDLRLNCEKAMGFRCRDANIQMGFDKDSIN